MNKFSTEDLVSLIEKIKIATGYTQADIETEAGYNIGYLSQVKTKGKVPEKLIEKLNLTFKDRLDTIAVKRDAMSLIVEQVLVMRAHIDVYGGLIVELLAHQRGTSSLALAEEVTTLLNRRLQRLKDELIS